MDAQVNLIEQEIQFTVKCNNVVVVYLVIVAVVRGTILCVYIQRLRSLSFSS